MTREETKFVLKTIMDAYPSFNPSDIKSTLEIWANSLKEEHFDDVMYRLNQHIRTNRFAPSVADLIKQNKTDFSNFKTRNYSHADFEEFERIGRLPLR